MLSMLDSAIQWIDTEYADQLHKLLFVRKLGAEEPIFNLDLV